MPGPLEGLVVVDATWGLPGSIAGLLLADYGAQVTKIERPGREDTMPVLRAVLERGKRSITLDLESGTGPGRLHELLAGADIFLDSFGPRRAAALGLEPQDVSARHPHLVHCALTGYGRDTPFADRPGYDALVAARLGLMSEQRGHRAGPVFPGHPTVSYCTGFLATIGVLAAVRARRLTGRGQLVDTSMLDGTLAVMSMNWWWNERDLGYLARTGTETGFGRNRLITDLFRCGDGEYLMMHTGGDGGFKRTTDILGFGDRVRHVDGLEMSVPLDDDEYHIARHLVAEAFLARPRDEWIAAFHAADLAALPVLRPEEIFEDEQIRWASVVHDVNNDGVGAVRQIGPVMRFAAAPPAAPSRAPRLGEHNGVMDEFARLTVTPAGSTDVRHPLAGVRVVDFSAFFATAYGARLLCDLGADVIKVEPVHGDQMRPLPDLFEGAQRGKRNLAIDLRDPRGMEAVQRLVATADVVMHNLRPGKAEKIGIGFEQLRAVNPGLVYCYLPGFGSSGPKKDLKSFAPLVSGFTGLLYIGAGEGNRPVTRVLGNEDLYNGMSGATAVLMALEHRARTGEGQYVESPHLHSSLFVRTEHCTDPDGHPIGELQLDAMQTGWSPLYRLYPTADGWICIACFGDAAFARLRDALELDIDAGDGADGALADALGARFVALTSEEAFALLDGADVPCEIPLAEPYMPELLWEEWAIDSERVYEHHHPEHGWIREMGAVLRLSDTPASNNGTSARLGQHSREILTDLGFGAPDIDELVRAGVVRVASS